MEPIFTKLVDQFIGGKLSRRDLIQGLAAASVVAGAPAVAATTRRDITCVGVNHISYKAKDYARTRDYYAQNLGMKVEKDTGTRAYLTFGDTFMLIRQGRLGDVTPVVDHIAYTIGGYGADPKNFAADHESIGAELNARGLKAESDEVALSWLMRDPENYEVQVSPTLMKLGNPLFEAQMAKPREKLKY